MLLHANAAGSAPTEERLPTAAAFAAGHGRQNVILAAFALLYAVLYAAFWPRAATTMDEASYLGFAYVLRHGTIFPDAVSSTVLLAFPVGGHFVSKYPLGMSALLALVSLAGGWTIALGTNLLVHLATFAVVVKILRERSLSPLWALLFLFHPTAILYSRTVMADPASGLLSALGLWQLNKGRWLYAGFWAGLALTFRTGNAVALPVFVLAAFLGAVGLSRAARFRAPLLAAAGSVPGVFLAAYYLVVVTRGQMGSNTGTFGLRYFPAMFGGYMVMLLVLYPALLLAPLLALLKRRDAFTLASAGLCYGVFALYSFWYYRDQGGSAVETLIVGQRYFLAVLPAFIITYAGVLQAFFAPRIAGFGAGIAARERAANGGLVLAFFLCAATAAGIHARHNKLLHQMVGIRRAVLQATSPQDLVFCNAQMGKLLPPAWGSRAVLLPSSDPAVDVRTIAHKLGGPPPPRAAAGAEERAELSHSPAQNGPGNVVVAVWARPGRTDDAEGAAQINALVRALGPNYALRSTAISSLPEGVSIAQVVKVQAAAVKEPQKP